MEIITDISTNLSRETSIALGTFDGVHLGHRAVIESAASFSDTQTAVFTFSQSPAGIISGEPVKALASNKLKNQLLEEMGVDILITPSFLEVKDFSAKEFVLLLINNFKAKHISCGFNFRFGRNKEGTALLLKEICKQHKVTVNVVPPVLEEDYPVSSSLIRQLLESGDLQTANKLLARPFTIDFEVTHGDGRGAKWEIPTINQKFPPNFVKPKYGVYLSRVVIDSKFYKSITSLGVRPTYLTDFVSAETFIFGFEGSLYGKNIPVQLIEFVREERFFTDKDELILAIQNDIDYANSKEY